MVTIVYSLAIVSCSWLALKSVTGPYISLCLYGIISAAFLRLIEPTVASLTKDMRTLDSRLGMAFSCMSFGALTGPPTGGAIETAEGRYLRAQVWSAASCMAVAILVTLARMCKTNWKIKVKG